MSITKKEARKLLRERGLRATSPRLAVLKVLAEAPNPLSHSEVLERLANTETPWWETDPNEAFKQGLILKGDNQANTLVGTSQEDYLLGENGADVFIAGKGDDGINGGKGIDRLKLS
ncbi:MAG: hypothetical protein AAGA81_24205, partial [Acidobacteriota bacterium]